MTTNRTAASIIEAGNASRVSAPRPRILVADAHDDTRALYRSAFAARGWDVVEACDGRDALAKVRASRAASWSRLARTPSIAAGGAMWKAISAA